MVIVGVGVVAAGTQPHSVIHQSGCSRPAFGSLENGYWLYRYEYCEVSAAVPARLPLTVIGIDAVRPPPVGASGSAYRTVTRVGGLRQREVDVLPGGQLDGLATRRLGGERVGVAVGADHGAVGGGALGLLLDEADVRAAAGDERRVERGSGDRGGGGRGGAGWADAADAGTTSASAASTAGTA